ncbi:hypothetical protein F5Y14DRAFT_455014 [Nemania sp. NC0429]|nr:hypothetical protein F5Y14DRAFT_455014 [Nemania sp. NC0429]
MGTKRTYDTAFSSGANLMQSGEFSDVIVECGDRTWNLHRVVLAYRCEYFRKALEKGRFKEAEDGRIVIHDQDPDHVDWVIGYMYTGKATEGLLLLLQDDSTVMDTCVDLFAVADFFTLDVLCKHATNVLIEHLVGYATRVQSAVGVVALPNHPSKLQGIAQSHQEFHRRFFAVVERTYSFGSTTFKRLKDALLLYPKLTRCIIFREEILGNIKLGDMNVAEFTADVLGSVVALDMGSERIPIPKKCSRCKKNGRCMTDFKVTRKWERYVTFDGVCKACHPLGDPDVLKSLGAVDNE